MQITVNLQSLLKSLEYTTAKKPKPERERQSKREPDTNEITRTRTANKTKNQQKKLRRALIHRWTDFRTILSFSAFCDRTMFRASWTSKEHICVQYRNKKNGKHTLPPTNDTHRHAHIRARDTSTHTLLQRGIIRNHSRYSTQRTKMALLLPIIKRETDKKNNIDGRPVCWYEWSARISTIRCTVQNLNWVAATGVAAVTTTFSFNRVMSTRSTQFNSFFSFSFPSRLYTGMPRNGVGIRTIPLASNKMRQTVLNFRIAYRVSQVIIEREKYTHLRTHKLSYFSTSISLSLPSQQHYALLSYKVNSTLIRKTHVPSWPCELNWCLMRSKSDIIALRRGCGSTNATVQSCTQPCTIARPWQWHWHFEVWRNSRSGNSSQSLSRRLLLETAQNGCR